jgi:hypothetical protein
MKTKITILLLLLCCMFATNVTAQQRYYVVQGYSNSGINATSWGSATGNLQSAIDAAYAHSKNNGGITVEVWVANGTYTPSAYPTNNDGSNSSGASGNPISDKDYAFIMKPNVQIYGGLTNGAVTRTSGRSFQNYTNNFSGGNAINGTVSGAGSILDGVNNRYHVIIALGNLGTACLDGFSITGGAGRYGMSADAGGGIVVNNFPIGRRYGGGIYIEESSPTFANLLVHGNLAHGGAGIHMVISNSTFTDIRVCDNVLQRANMPTGPGVYWDYEVRGAGIAVTGTSNVHFTNVTVHHNIAHGVDDYSSGGGICIGVETSRADGEILNATFTNCTISHNIAGSGGGLCFDYTTATINNCQIVDNTGNYSVDGYTGGGGIHISDYSKITINNSNLSRNTAFMAGGAMDAFDNSTVTINNSTLTENKALRYGGAGIFSTKNSKFNINSSTINKNEATNSTDGVGGAIWSTDGSIFNIYGSIIEHNKSNASGGGIVAGNSTYTIDNSTISNNTAGSYSGGIGATSSTFNIYGGTIISHNKASSFGGGICALSDAIFNIYGGTIISQNDAGGYGGGIYSNYAEFNIYGSTSINNNTTLDYGAGICASYSTFDIYGSTTISKNSVFNQGGGIEASYSTVTIRGGSVISQNDAYTGGGIYGNTSSKFNIYDGSIISQNKANSGGGIAGFSTSEFNIHGNNTIINENEAIEFGGGIYGSGSAEFTIYDGIFINNNIARDGVGGGISSFGTAQFTIYGGTSINNNTAYISGGGIYGSGTSKYTIYGRSKINNNTATNGFGGGIAALATSAFNISDYCTIDENTSSSSGGIHFNNGTNTVINSFIRGNISYSDAVALGIVSNNTFINVLISGNRGGSYGGVGINTSGTTHLTNVTIAGNSGRGLYVNNTGAANLTLHNTIVWGNVTNVASSPAINAHHSLIQGLNYTTNGNIDGTLSHPSMFVGGIPYVNATTAGNYKLLSASPAANAGNDNHWDVMVNSKRIWDHASHSNFNDAKSNAKDLASNARFKATVDMGAYEFDADLQEEEKVTLKLIVFLQGTMKSNGTMTNYMQTADGTYSLYDQPCFPETNPYGISGNIYSEETESGPAGELVDWVRVDILRILPDYKVNILESKALLLKTTGEIVDTDGQSPKFDPQDGEVRILVSHRNHLAVMSPGITLTDGMVYNFSTDVNKADKDDPADPNPMTSVNGIWCMYAGDINADYMIGDEDYMQIGKAYNLDADSYEGQYVPYDLTIDGMISDDDYRFGVLNYTIYPICPMNFYTIIP